jgi:hypothetical protein
MEPWRSQVDEIPRAHWDPLVWDGIAQYYPWRLFAARALGAGVLPLWNPHQFCGTPFVANGQSAVFYPLNLVFWIVPVASAFGWSAWLHLGLTGWFLYLLLRRLGVGRFGATAGSVVWQGNAFFVAWMHLPTVLCTASWLPLVLLLAGRAVTSGRTRSAVAAGVALGVSYLGGHPQIFLFVCLMTVAYLIARAWSRGLDLAPPKRLRRLASVGLVIGLTGAGLSALQALPTWELLGIAHRASAPGPEGYRSFVLHAMPGAQLSGLIVPHAFGHPGLGSYVGRDNYAEFAAYVGAAALALALWGAVSSRTWHARYFAAALLVSFLLVLGTPLNWLVYHWVPGIARSGGPGRLVLLAVFSMSVLAAVGADELARRSAQRSRVALAGLSVAVVVLGAGYWAYLLWVKPTVMALQPGSGTRTTWEGIQAGLVIILAVSCVVMLSRPRRRYIGQVALIMLLAADLVLAARGHLHISPQQWVYSAPRFDTSKEGRVLGNARDWPINRFPIAALPPNSATVHQLRDVFGYDSLYLARFRDFAAAVQHGDPSPPLNGNMLLPRLSHTYGLDMMSLAAVETVVSPIPVRGLRMERAGAYYVYSNPYAWPRAWVAESAVHVGGQADAVAALVQLAPSPDRVIVTGMDELAGEVAGEERPSARVRDTTPNQVVVELSGPGGGYLFLADAFAPGWRAYAGARRLSVRPAYVGFRTVSLPVDAESVVFRYEPGSFRLGLFVSLLTAMAIAAVCAQRPVWRRERP